MKGVSLVFTGFLVVSVATLGYFNFQQQKTIELLNEEIFEQAKLRRNIILEKHVLEQKIQSMEVDSITNESPELVQNRE
jgi:hypothetical protein